MHNSETPTLPYCINGIKRHSKSPWVHVPCMYRYALNGKTIIQNIQSAIHKLHFRIEIVLVLNNILYTEKKNQWQTLL